MGDPNLKAGIVSVRVEGVEDFSVDGTLNVSGWLSGMAKLYKLLSLNPGAIVEFSVARDDTIIVHSPRPATKPGEAAPAERQTVFQRQKLKHLHLEPFRPENLNNWEPETETDVYLAFGVLQNYTDYHYCCGTSKSVLDRLGAKYEGKSKPDAILVDTTSGEYVFAEWKMSSSDFASNHNPDDVDVLVCWIDDETNRALLPADVVCLRSIAKSAAIGLLG